MRTRPGYQKERTFLLPSLPAHAALPLLTQVSHMTGRSEGAHEAGVPE